MRRDACHGGLWISSEVLPIEDFQGTSVMNYANQENSFPLAFMSLGTSILNVIIQKIKLML